jgi:YegS/Rv2252/BmrU family lipid kinase
MAQPRFCVIYNPSAGRGGSAQRWRQVQELLGDEVDYRPSERPWHAAELAEAAAREGFEAVVAAGGDGTVHEVINGILQADRPDVTFAVLPLGSGNDYARMIETPFDAEGMIRQLHSTEVWPVDIGMVQYHGRQRYFCNTLGMGLSGHVTCEAKKIRWLRGIPLYGLAALKGICKHFRSCPIRWIEEHREQETHLLYLAVGLGKAEGGGFIVAPNAKLDDGLFDLLHVTQLTRFQALRYLPKMITGNLPPENDQIRRRQSTGFRIEAERPIPMHADGEVLASSEAGVTECEVRLLPGRLKLRGRPPAGPDVASS